MPEPVRAPSFQDPFAQILDDVGAQREQELAGKKPKRRSVDGEDPFGEPIDADNVPNEYICVYMRMFF